MAANMQLVEERGVSDDSVEKINALHDALTNLITEYSLECDYDDAFALVTRAEFQLQRLWGFSEDSAFHTWVKRLNYKHFQLFWVGRTFQCHETGAVVTIPEDIYERQLIHISGVSAIDLGVCNGYSRMIGKVKEVIETQADMDRFMLTSDHDVKMHYKALERINHQPIEPRVLYTSTPTPSLLGYE